MCVRVCVCVCGRCQSTLRSKLTNCSQVRDKKFATKYILNTTPTKAKKTQKKREININKN